MASDDEHVFKNIENGIDECLQINGKQPRNTFLNNFASITSSNSKLRLKSGGQIFKHLSKNNENNVEFKYTIARFIRGLGSAKLASRIGFFTSLTVLLQRTPKNKYDINQILDVIQKELHTSGQNSKSENADIHTGLILVCGSVLRSGRLQDLDSGKRHVLLQQLVDASGKKSYLGLLATALIVDSLEKLDKKVFTEDLLLILRPQLKKPLQDYTMDNLYLLLKFHEYFPTVITPKFLGNLIDSQGIITTANVNSLVKVLTHIMPVKNIEKHPVYEYFTKRLAETDLLSKFLVALDRGFVKVPQIKHQVQAVLLTHLIANLKDINQLPLVFGKNFVRETVAYFKTTDRKIQSENEITITLFEFINATVQAAKDVKLTSESKLQVMEALMFYPGSFCFENASGTKVLQQITSTLDIQGVKQLNTLYKHVMLADIPKQKNDEETEEWSNFERVEAARLITNLLNHPVMKSELQWKNQQLELLMEVALMNTRQNVGVAFTKQLKDIFFNALEARLPKLQDKRTRLSLLVHVLNEKLNAGELRVGLDDDVKVLWVKAVGMIDKIEKKSKSTHLTPVFHTLLLHMALQLFNDTKLVTDSSKVATDSLQELFAWYEKRKSQDEEVDWIEIVVDLFLNLLSHNSLLLRSMIGCVFPYLCQDLTATTMHQILQVLDPKADDNPLSQVSDDDSDDDDEQDDEQTKDSNDSDSDQDSDDDDDDEDGDEFEEAENDRLRQAIREVLSGNENAALSDVDSVDVDDMSDSECDKLNNALGEAFKRFRPSLARRKSKKQSRDDKTLTHFRVRVMDLIDIYLDSNVSMIICLEIMLPLLQSFEFSIRDAHQKPLHTRINSTLKKLSRIKQFASVEDVDENVLCTLLQSLLDTSSKSAMMVAEMGSTISDCCMFIVKCSTHVSTNGKSKVADILVETLKTFFTKRDCQTPFALFKNIMHSSWVHKVLLVKHLLWYVFNDDIRPFRRRQALNLLRMFYTDKRALATNQKKYTEILGKCIGSFIASTIEFFQEKEYKCKESFLISLLLLLAGMKNSCLQFETNGFDWTELGVLVRDYRSGISIGTECKSAYNKLCSSLKVPIIVEMKQKLVKLSLVNDEKDDDADADELGGKKKKGNKDDKKLKKQARNLRMASLSEGIGKNFTFTETDVDVLNENDEGDQEMEVEDAVTIPKTKKIVENGLNNKKKEKGKRKTSNSPSGPNQELVELESSSPKKEKGENAVSSPSAKKKVDNALNNKQKEKSKRRKSNSQSESNQKIVEQEIPMKKMKQK